MIDRFGKTINIGWSNHQVLWIEAALTLPRPIRSQAYADIAAMTGRNIGAVRGKASRISKQKNKSKKPVTYSRDSLLTIAAQLREEARNVPREEAFA